jgi:hypothetical protein
VNQAVDGIQLLAPTSHGGDGFVWIGGPGEGLWGLIGLGDEAVDGGLEVDDGSEDAALEAAGEPAGRTQEPTVAGDFVIHLGVGADGG